jgi:antitoxin StbD
VDNTDFNELGDTMTTTVSATDFQKKFGLFHDRAQREPVMIMKHSRVSVVMIGIEEYERLKRSERRAYRIRDMPEDLVEAIATAEIPPEHRVDETSD